jgi:hypothetical protein
MTDLAIYQPGEMAAAPPPTGPLDSWIAVADQVVRLAQTICSSPFVPDGLRGSVPATAAAILAGRELGIPPMTSLANVHVIKGKTGISALLMRALIQAQGHDWQDGHVSDTSATVRGRRRGETEWTEVTFTIAQARFAKIDMNGYPQDKLYARATSRLARRKFADVIAGMPYSAEELEDGDPGDGPAPAIEAPKNGGQPAQRTARRGRAQNVPPADDAATPQPHAGPATPPQAGTAGGTPLPPLPGEEENSGPGVQDETPGSGPTPGPEPDQTDYDTPGTVTTPQITAIWTVLSSVYKFTKDEKDQARAVCAHIVGRELASTKDMSKNEGKAVLDTLANWREVAEQHETEPREFLVQLLATEAQAGDGNG